MSRRAAGSGSIPANASRWSTARSTPTWSMCIRARRRSTARRRRPQSGQAELCVRDGKFEIPDGRNCPRSQQARFSAARPSDSRTTARWSISPSRRPMTTRRRGSPASSGCLTIAGYDAYPIDGVEGAKTAKRAQEIPRRPQAAGRRRRASPTSSTRCWQAARNPQGRGFAWCNDTKYAVMAALGVVEMGVDRHPRLVSRRRRQMPAARPARRSAPALQLTPRRWTATAARSSAATRRLPGAAACRCARARAASTSATTRTARRAA